MYRVDRPNRFIPTTKKQEEGMRSRFVAGWKGLVLAAAIASLILLPAGVFAKSGAAPVTGTTQGLSAVPQENQPLKPLALYARSRP